MKKILLFLLTVPALSLAQAVSINAAESNIHWVGKKVTGQHEGNISLKSGSLEMADGKLVGGNFVVDMNTIVVTDLEGDYKNNLEGHLNSDDFFGVANHAEAQLVFTSVQAADDKTYDVTGDFTIKGITKPASFQLEMGTGEAHAKVVIDRTQFNIRYGSDSFFDNLGDKAIYNDFELDVTLKM